jgi:hypothetical protein
MPEAKAVVQCYASIADDDCRFSWLSLEDAGDGEYLSDIEEHRILAQIDWPQ